MNDNTKLLTGEVFVIIQKTDFGPEIYRQDGSGVSFLTEDEAYRFIENEDIYRAKVNSVRVFESVTAAQSARVAILSKSGLAKLTENEKKALGH